MPTYMVTLWFENSRTFPMEAENELEAYRRAVAGTWTDAEFDHPEATTGGEGYEVGSVEVPGEGGEIWFKEELQERDQTTAASKGERGKLPSDWSKTPLTEAGVNNLRQAVRWHWPRAENEHDDN
jgi:hypothetical protein